MRLDQTWAALIALGLLPLMSACEFIQQQTSNPLVWVAYKNNWREDFEQFRARWKAKDAVRKAAREAARWACHDLDAKNTRAAFDRVERSERMEQRERIDAMFEEFHLAGPLTPSVPVEEDQDVLPAYLPCSPEDREAQFRREEKLFADQMGAHAFTKIMQAVKEGRWESAQENEEREYKLRQIATIKAETARLKVQLAEMRCLDRRTDRGAKFQGPC